MVAFVCIFKIWTTKLHKFECTLQHGSHFDCVQFYSKISFQNKLFILLFFNVLTDLLLMLQGKQGRLAIFCATTKAYMLWFEC
jgi:hypothetical protein